MLSDAERRDAMAVLQKSVQNLPAPEHTAQVGESKGTSDIKSIIESFHANNVFVMPAKKQDVISESDRQKLNSIAIDGLHKLYGGK